MVAVKKANGAVRICGDFSTGLNEAIQRHKYSLFIPNHFAKLNGIRVFAILAFSDAFLENRVKSC